jgi:phenylpropionate dioxygenase-like ring-hydroxylating dioxygenase large terminal subunit
MSEPAWVALHPSSAVAPGAILAADVGEVELVVWRALDGQAVVMDARCPHQWSHLEAEGLVDGDELVCTAHFWRFDGEGCGTKLSILGRRDAKADIEVYPTRERDGMIEAMLVSNGGGAGEGER